MVKIVVPAALALVVGLVIGFFVGRALLERQWSQPYSTITPEAHERSANEKADPTPPANTKIVRPMPILRARAAVKAMTEADPVAVLLSDEGSGDKGIELHVVVENHAKCALAEIAGVAYGFDAEGRPARMNYGGESYVAFKNDFSKEPLAPGKRVTITQRLAYVDAATNGVAHVDAYRCTDGTAWARQ